MLVEQADVQGLGPPVAVGGAGAGWVAKRALALGRGCGVIDRAAWSFGGHGMMGKMNEVIVPKAAGNCFWICVMTRD